MPYTALTLTTLTATQTAYQLDSGHMVIVDIQSQAIPTNIDSTSAEAHIALFVQAWKINPDGTPYLDSHGAKIQAPAKSISIRTPSLADGSTTLVDVKTNAIIDALTRMDTWIAIRSQVMALQLATAIQGATLTISSGNPQTAAMSAAFAHPLAVCVIDSTGAPVVGATVLFAAPATGASCAIAGGPFTTNSQGIATSGALTANATAGSYTVTASISGCLSTVSFALTNQ